MTIYQVTCCGCGSTFNYEPANEEPVFVLRSKISQKGNSKIIVTKCPNCQAENKFKIII
jgi:Fe-S oxidoreductase